MKLNEDQIDVLLRRTADAMHLVGVGGIIASVFDDATIGLSLLGFMFFRKLFKSTLNNRLHRNLACVIDKSSRGTKLKRAIEELPLRLDAASNCQ